MNVSSLAKWAAILGVGVGIVLLLEPTQVKPLTSIERARIRGGQVMGICVTTGTCGSKTCPVTPVADCHFCSVTAQIAGGCGSGGDNCQTIPYETCGTKYLGFCDAANKCNKVVPQVAAGTCAPVPSCRTPAQSGGA